MAGQNQESLEDVLRGLSQGPGVRRDNLQASLSDELRALWQITEQDDPLRVREKIVWQLNNLVSQLQEPAARTVARYSFNITDDPKIEALPNLGSRQKVMDGISDRSAIDLMSKKILPVFVVMLQSGKFELMPEPERSEPVVAAPPAVATSPAPAPGRAVRPRTLVLGGVGVVAVALVVVLVVVLSPRSDTGVGQPTASSNAALASSSSPQPPLAPFDGTTHTEQQGTLGTDAYSDPFGTPDGPPVQPLQEVQVSCKIRAVPFPSVNPDGNWYRLEGEPWNGQYYAVANTFLNGDPIGGATGAPTNTDVRVPDCPD